MEILSGHFKSVHISVFQENLVVWKLSSKGVVYPTPEMFQENLVVWKWNTMRVMKSGEWVVSGELSSMEICIISQYPFQKSVFVSGELSSMEMRFCISGLGRWREFQENLVVWK